MKKVTAIVLRDESLRPSIIKIGRDLRVDLEHTKEGAIYKVVLQGRRAADFSVADILAIANQNVEQVRRNQWFDRSPIMKNIRYLTANVAPHASTERDSYTVPVGKLAKIIGIFGQITRSVAATTLGVVFGRVNTQTLSFFELEHLNNTVGSNVVATMGECGILKEREKLSVFTWDTSIGGTMDYWITANLVEFDA